MAIGSADTDRNLRGILLALCLLDNSIDSISQNTHHRHAQLLGITFDVNNIHRNIEQSLDAIFLDISVEIVMNHLLVLM